MTNIYIYGFLYRVNLNRNEVQTPKVSRIRDTKTVSTDFWRAFVD
jgi:hypothetical protein